MGITTVFSATPWARGALLRDPERTTLIADRAGELRIQVRILGKSSRGPWTVMVGTASRTLRFGGSDLHNVLEFALDCWAGGADDREYDWIAAAGGIAHAQQKRGRTVRSACGVPALDPRYRHPERGRCHACWRALTPSAVAA